MPPKSYGGLPLIVPLPTVAAGTFMVVLACIFFIYFLFIIIRRKISRSEIFEFIEMYYNPKRLHSSLGYLSPNDYEKKINKKDAG